MKKLILFLGLFCFVALGAMAQRGIAQTVTVDTVKGAETVYFAFEVTKGGVDAVFQAVATNIGGTTNEKGYLEFSTDGSSYQRYANAVIDDYINLYASDTAKIANLGNEWTATTANSFGGIIWNSPFRYYRVAIVGEASDTTSYAVKWGYKNK